MPRYHYQELIDTMSLEEKVQFCSGADIWSTKAFEIYKIPAIKMTDGPHGIRHVSGGRPTPGSKQTIPATCFPPACTTACSWDRDLLQEMGAAIAEEALQEGVSIVLGPGVNIKRNPLCGRNFEYFSEDPYLAGEMAVAWIKGVQGKGVGVSVKHYAANNQESQRMSSDSIVDERTLREIYLPAFERAVKDAKPATVMCAYNKLNGIYCSENTHLLREILRDEWGYEGVIVSDWGAVNDRVEAFKAGLDLEMPSSGGFFDQEVIEAVKSGALPVERINESVDRLLALISSSSQPRTANYRYDAEAHQRLAERIASNSAVLLKNQDALLPIDRKSRIALIGALAKEPHYQGAGSSWINPTSLLNAIDGFDSQRLDYIYYPGYSLNSRQDDRLLSEAVTGAKNRDVSVIIAGLPPADESEGFDHANMQLPPQQDELIFRVSEVTPNTLVVLTSGAPVEMPWLSSVKAVLNMYLPGQAGGLAIAKLLTGAENPCGKLAESYPISYADVPSAGFYEEGEYQAQYREGIYVGYRYYEAAKKEVNFPFGHGLSYTTFDYVGINLSKNELQEGETLIIGVTVKNAGDVDGAEVVQLYVSGLEKAVFHPEKELKDFAKVFLRAGEARQVDFHLDSRSFAEYDVAMKAWVVPQGTYRISIGASSRDIRLAGNVIVHGKRLPQDPVSQVSWYTSLQGRPTQADFEALLGHKIAPLHKPKKGEYTLNSSLSDLQKSLPIRIMLKVIERTVAKGYGGVDYSNPNFRGVMEVTATNPLKSMVIASSGLFGLNIAEGLVDMANGHFFKGLRSFIRKQK